MKAWKFIRADLKLCHDETKSWKVGKTQEVDTSLRKLDLCNWGLHASVKSMDALQYASSERVRLALVEVSGETINGYDKLCAERMKPLYIASEKSTQRALRLFACRCARKALKLVKNPDPRSVKAVEVSEAYANGRATQAELVAAGAAAGAAARAALAPTVAPLQESAHELVVRMATATEEKVVPA